MANTFDSNITQKLIRVFLEKFEMTRVLSKNVNTQLLEGKFDPSSGDEVNFKRPTDYRSVRTSDGDLTSETDSDIITGKAKGLVQDFFSVSVNFKQVDQALKMDQLDQLLAPMATRIVNDLEVDFAKFMMQNSGLRVGTPGTKITGWSDVALAGALMESAGVPKDGNWKYSVNPFTQVTLSEIQRTLGSGGVAGQLVSDAMRNATLVEDFAGMRVMSATSLGTYTGFDIADRAGTLTAAPNATYLAAKDTMTQTLAVTAFGANTVVTAGETLTIANVNRLNLATRQLMIDEDGDLVPWTGTVVSDVTLSGTGAGNIVVTGPAIFEATGQYNTVDAAPANGAVVTLSTAQDTTLQPNLFWHRQAFSIGSVPLDKLFATDTIGETEDGLQFRVTRFSDGVKNLQKVRFDFLPAYAALNPFFAGQGFGTP